MEFNFITNYHVAFLCKWKEKIADSIHTAFYRNGQAFIKINCGALPSSLIESELFGHEKASFRGATDRRIGKFEEADKGTFFLVAIGELQLES
jgi:transcriptional regulator with GAF, ATPase, and Fis domain